ncbi:MAG: SagB family peptide dehydrogenase [Holophagales bacterium]|nr:SagB family peptide dehydrogenase [Holophagales bacterium]
MVDGPRLRLARGTTVEEAGPRQLVVRRGSFRAPFGDLGEGTREAFRVLSGAGGDGRSLADHARRDGALALLRFLQILEDLEACNLLGRIVPARGDPLLIFEPFFCPAPRRSTARAPAGPVTFSRFAMLRRGAAGLTMESPLVHGSLLPNGREGSALLGSLMSGPFDRQTLRRTLAGRLEGCDEGLDEVLMDLLWQTGFLTAVDPEGRGAEDLEPSLQQWEAHDLYFHSRSRAGRQDSPYGATFPFRDRCAPLPALPPVDPEAPFIELPRSDPGSSKLPDPPLTEVLETRRSERNPASDPLTLDQLGELFFRAARIRRLETDGDCETSRRVYPGGGALYELEIYPVVHRCRGLEAGLYHYDAWRHGLWTLGPPSEESRALLKAAGQTARAPQPDVLLVLAARFQRVSWKYGSMAYAGILKNVGVLLQTFYLVATAMKLRVCALGGGNSDLFARATGKPYTEESSVGELIVNGSDR